MYNHSAKSTNAHANLTKYTIEHVGESPIFKALEEAISREQISEVEMLLKKNPTLINSTNKNGYTPLHIAANSCQDKVLELLIAKGVDLLAIDYYGCTALHMVSRCTGESAERIIDMLLSNNPALAEVRNIHGKTAIYQAAANDIIALAGIFPSEMLMTQLYPRGISSEDSVIKKWLENAIVSYDRHINRCNCYKEKILVPHAKEEDYIKLLFGNEACNYYKRANVLYALGEVEKAIKSYEESINLEPNYVYKLFPNCHKNLDFKVQYSHNKLSRSMLNRLPPETLSFSDEYGANLLYQLAECGRKTDTQLLMEKMKPQTISASIYMAMERSNWKVAITLVSSADSKAIAYRYEDGRTLLHMAAWVGSSKLVELLLAKITPEAILLKDFMNRTAWLSSFNKEIAEMIIQK